jgi:hypothetical protein
VACTPDHNRGVRSLFHSTSSSQVASLGERKDAKDKKDAKKFGRVLSGGITTKNTLPSSHIQALMLQEASGYEPVLTTLSKQELCKEAGLQVSRATQYLVVLYCIAICVSAVCKGAS